MIPKIIRTARFMRMVMMREPVVPHSSLKTAGTGINYLQNENSFRFANVLQIRVVFHSSGQ